MKRGRCPGIYTDYHEVLVQTLRYPNSEYRRFSSYADALNYMNQEATNIIEVETQSDIVMMFDGGSRGNPGKSGSGVVLIDKYQRQWRGYKYLGEHKTNNEAEYEGMIIGLKYIHHHRMYNISLEIKGDSKLVINQMQGVWSCNTEHLQKKLTEAKSLLRGIKDVTFTWIPRERNQIADQLSNDAMDTETSSIPYADKLN